MERRDYFLPVELRLSAKGYKRFNSKIDFLLKSTKVKSQKFNCFMERRDYFLPVELRLSAKGYKRFNSKIDFLLKITKVSSQKLNFIYFWEGDYVSGV